MKFSKSDRTVFPFPIRSLSWRARGQVTSVTMDTEKEKEFIKDGMNLPIPTFSVSTKASAAKLTAK